MNKCLDLKERGARKKKSNNLIPNEDRAKGPQQAEYQREREENCDQHRNTE